MPISTVQALKIVDQNLYAIKNHKTSMEENNFSKLPQMKYAEIKELMSTQHSHRIELRSMLPAFRIEWRGGPSPIDNHQGSSKCSAMEILLSRQNKSEKTDVNYNSCFNISKQPRFEYLKNDSKSIIAKGIDNTCKCAKLKALTDKANLSRVCLRRYPHGALGLKESPYGDGSFIYGTLSRQYIQESRRLLGYTDYLPVDSLCGGVLRPEESNQTIPLINFREAPRDHLLGGVILPDCRD